MSNNISSFKNIEEALENPGAYIFQLNDNQINFSKNKSIYNTQTINTIKNNIIKCFRTLNEKLFTNSEYLNHIKNILSSYTKNQNFKFQRFTSFNILIPLLLKIFNLKNIYNNRNIFYWLFIWNILCWIFL